MLCDSFYNDIKADHNFILQPYQINSEIEILKENFNNRQTIQKVFEEDDVLDMQDYFRENFSSKANNVIFSNFFEEISLLISKAKPNEWKDIFSLEIIDLKLFLIPSKPKIKLDIHFLDPQTRPPPFLSLRNLFSC